MQVRSLRPDEIAAAAAMLARAFVGRPFTRLLGDDEPSRLAASRCTFSGMLRYGLRYGECLVAENARATLLGAAIWWAPEHVEPTAEQLAECGLAEAQAVVGPVAWARIDAYDAVASQLHRAAVSGPHWYLCAVGTAPEAQGQGVGSALLASMYERLDREGLPAYLDTNVSENVAFYGRRGFVLTGAAVDPASGILVRGMRRDPSPPGTSSRPDRLPPDRATGPGTPAPRT
ncbi:MAG: GNAT family N-acetyltransferase [Chloroflexi bacterium]|nr:GNAT family N-acetyltransferase [Chloroflexota bacterium]